MYGLRDGFTLLEAVVALAIISTVAVGALGAVGADVRSAARARPVLEAAALAEDRMEAVRLLDPGGLRPLPDSLRNGTFEPPFDGYGWRTVVRPAMDGSGLYDVEITVEWSGGTYPLGARLYRPESLRVPGGDRR